MADESEHNEISEFWREWRRIQSNKRAAVRDHGTEELQKLKEEGYLVIELTPYHFRINGELDIYPTNRKYHYLPDNKRGKIRRDISSECFRWLRHKKKQRRTDYD